jgi:hypothetical protein
MEGMPEDNRFPQFYSTEVWGPEGDFGVSFTTVPTRSLADRSLLEVPEYALEGLDLVEVASFQLTPDDAPAVIAALLAPPSTSGSRYWRSLGELSTRPGGNVNPRIREFSEYVVYADVIPVEHSPVGPDSLAKLIAAGGGAGVGALVGFMAAGGPTPLLFLTVPAGIIICGSAQGIADGASEGLRHRVREWIKGDPDR